MENYEYKTLATCPTIPKIIGENVILLVDITQGTAPYTITYKKDGSPIFIQTYPTNGSFSFVYATIPSDATPLSHIFSVEVVDSCIPSQTFIDQCSVQINASACIIPICSFNVS